MSEEKGRLTDPRIGDAYHEAGHAVASVWEGIKLMTVTITPETVTIAPDKVVQTLGHCELPPLAVPGEAQIRSYIIASLAGQIAEERKMNKIGSPWNAIGLRGRHDDEQSVILARQVTRSDREGAAYLRWLHVRCEDMIQQPHIWRGIKAVAAALLKRQTLTGDEATAIIRLAFAGR